MRVLKYEVPIDDQLHEIGSGKVVLVDYKDVYTAYVWVLVDERAQETARLLGVPEKITYARVFGTGHPVDGMHEHVGSYVWNGPGMQYVWHVFTIDLRAQND